MYDTGLTHGSQRDHPADFSHTRVCETAAKKNLTCIVILFVGGHFQAPRTNFQAPRTKSPNLQRFPWGRGGQFFEYHYS